MIVNDQLIIPLCKALSPHQPRGGGRQAERRGLRLEPAPPRLQHCSRFGRLLAHLEDRQPYVSEASPLSKGKRPIFQIASQLNITCSRAWIKIKGLETRRPHVGFWQ